jgi:hypothetical protein
MLENFFYKLGYRFTRFHFRKESYEVKRFTNFFTGCNNILIILPFDPKQFDDAKDIILGLRKTWNERKIAVIVRDQFTAFNEFKEYYQTFGFSKEDINRFFLPRKRFIQEISRFNYDLVIDLNFDLHLASSYLAKTIVAEYRIGIKKELADLFYNFQYDPVDINGFRNVYNNLFNSINQFCIMGEKNEIQS